MMLLQHTQPQKFVTGLLTSLISVDVQMIRELYGLHFDASS